MPVQIEFFAGILELFLNFLEFIALFVSAATFFFLMINKFSKGLKQILAPCGFGLGPKIRALFVCRSSPVKKRAFIEFAMLKSQGRGLVSADWHSIINEFKAFYRAEESQPTFELPNCTLLVKEEFTRVVERYFEYFSEPKVRKTFGIHDERITWILQIRVEEAYATPTCLLTGLLSRFEENWRELIKLFISTAYTADADNYQYNDVLTNELYFTFAWLLWGPSYEMKYKTYWAGLCQLSYGDESISIPAVADADSEIMTKLQEVFLECEGRQYGALLTADLSIHEPAAYYKSFRDTVNPENAYFYDKVAGADLAFAAQIESFNVFDNYKARKYYCTAYVWVMFELEDAEAFAFRPEKSLAFFEHANLTDKNTYQFLTETLIDKSVAHFTKVFAEPAYAGRKYRFVCAMNEEITEGVQRRYREIMAEDSAKGRAFSERILLAPKHSPAAVFSAFDAYFAPIAGINFAEISLKDKRSVSELGRFYTEIYMESFIDANERESFDNLLVYLRLAERAETYRYHIILAKDSEGNIVGGGIFDYFAASNAGVVEFLAVRGDCQSSGIGTVIYKYIQDVIAADAYMMLGKQPAYIFCELDKPEYSKFGNKKYLYFWDKHHFRRLDFTYLQPALSLTQAPVRGLWFAVSQLFGNDTEVSGELVTSVIRDYMRCAMQIEKPEENADFQHMQAELAARAVPLLRIVS